MNAQSPSGNRSPARKRGGYSLMELMIVVAITGILAAISIPVFSGYIQRSRTSEAVDFLGVIKLRQEAFRAEFGAYSVCNGHDVPSKIVFEPDRSVVKNAVALPFDATTTNGACFDAIGARPGGPVRFGYGWAAGLPASTAGLLSEIPAYGTAWSDHYFVAQAVTDLDGNGNYCTYELTSFTRSLWYTPARGWD